MELLFFDTETGGLDPYRNSLLQIGLIAYKDGNILDEKEISIKSECYNVSAFSLKFNNLNLYEDVYKKGVSEEVAVREVIQFISKNFKGIPVLVGHNPSLDKYMLKELFHKQGLDFNEYVNHRMIDTMSLIWALNIVEKLPIETCSSDGAFKYFNINVEKRHNALDDCLATVKLYENLMYLFKIN